MSCWTSDTGLRCGTRPPCTFARYRCAQSESPEASASTVRRGLPREQRLGSCPIQRIEGRPERQRTPNKGLTAGRISGRDPDRASVVEDPRVDRAGGEGVVALPARGREVTEPVGGPADEIEPGRV